MNTIPRLEFVHNIENLSKDDFEKLKKIEIIEHYYLNKYYHFLKYVEDEMLDGFHTKEYIKDDWIKFWGGSDQSTSDFAVGAERIVYALLNGKGIGKPNSCPVGSDLMFELEDAFIHIDLKTVNTENIGDYNTSIFVGKNQNSYNYYMCTKGEKRDYTPHLPPYYTLERNQKICLSYFVTILYDKATLETMCITITCMPNGLLSSIYGSAPLKAGKTQDMARFNFSEVQFFETISNSEKLIPRTRVIYINEAAERSYSTQLRFLIDLYHSSENNF